MISHLRGLAIPLFVLGVIPAARSQVIEFENNGLRYQTLTRQGMTVMFTQLRSHVRDYAMYQVAVSNGSDTYRTVRPEDFSFLHRDGESLPATPAAQVISMLMEKGSHSDVVKLVTLYENALYGIPHMKLTNGYEQRRQAAFSEGVSSKFKAAAAASALSLVETRLAPSQSTDGAIFFSSGKALSGGRIVVHNNGEVFEFNPE